ncbi:hypothetical protein NFI96_010194 [Prochilodus magdalenae]|nr:hypothetical protein NFI96_010194 [Prochilodus magdalenae]
MSVLTEVMGHLDLMEPRFCVAIIAIIFNPFFWNVLYMVARWEHRTRGLTRLFGSPYVACYCLGTLILLLNVYRSHRYRTRPALGFCRGLNSTYGTDARIRFSLKSYVPKSKSHELPELRPPLERCRAAYYGSVRF